MRFLLIPPSRASFSWPLGSLNKKGYLFLYFFDEFAGNYQAVTTPFSGFGDIHQMYQEFSTTVQTVGNLSWSVKGELDASVPQIHLLLNRAFCR